MAWERSGRMRVGEVIVEWVAHSSRMLKKSASFVLASLRGSTYRSVRLASSLAAALLDDLFEHPAYYSDTITLRLITPTCRTKTEFFRKLLDGLLKPAQVYLWHSARQA